MSANCQFGSAKRTRRSSQRLFGCHFRSDDQPKRMLNENVRASEQRLLTNQEA
jgi:hypothetical protein